MEPPDGSINLNKAKVRDDFPAPVLPTGLKINKTR